MMKNRTERATGCTLDFNNLNSIATLWTQMVNMKLVVELKKQVEDKKSDTHLTLRQHDANLLRLLNTWSQSTKIIADEIVERCQEMQKIIEENPEEYQAYLKATGAIAAASADTTKEEGKNETH